MQKHIAQFFKFLQDKEGKPAPLRLKLLDPQTFGKPTKEQLAVKGDLDLKETNIKELPQDLKVGRSLFLTNCTSLEKLPQGLQVGDHLWAYGCVSLKELPKGFKVKRNLDLQGCTSLKELPQDLEVRWSVTLQGCTSLKELPQGLQVGGNLYIRNTPIAEKYSEDEIRKMIEDGGGFVNGIIFT